MKNIFKAIGVVMVTVACTFLTSLAINLPMPASYVQAAVTLTSEGTCGDTATYTYADGVLTISGTGSIENNAFKKATQITKVVIQNGITEIGQSAFEGCSALTEISIPDSVTEIKSAAFASSGLTSLTLPSTLTKLGACILEENTGVTEVIIPNTVVTMRENYGGYYGAFYGSAVETVTFQNGIKTVPAMACHGAAHLTAVSIPNSVTVIEESAFSECSDLPKISISDSVTEIESAAFAFSGLTSLTLPPTLTKLGACILRGNTGVTEVMIPATVVTMRENYGGYHGAFHGSTVETVTFQNGIKTVPAMACHGTAHLTSVSIPDSVTVIGESAFNGCSALSEIRIPDSVTEIKSGAFAYSGLTSLNFPPVLTKLGACILEENTGVKEVMIPDTVVIMRENYGGYHGALYGSAVEKVTFQNGIKAVPAMACHGAKHLTDVSIPNSVAVIGESAFNGCSALPKISIPDSVIEIESGTFAYSGLTSLTLPPTLTKLGACILWDNIGVTEITIPGTIVTMRENYGAYHEGYHGAFYRSAVETLTFQKGIKTVPAMACHGMKKAKAVVIPVSVTRFEEDVFKEVGNGIVVHAYTGSYAMSYAQRSGIATKSIGQCIASKITASDVTKVTSKKAIVFSLKAKTTGKGPLSYQSNNRSVNVNDAGTITIAKNFVGTAKITITVDTVNEYLGTSKVITITVKPSNVKLKKLKKLKQNGRMTVTWAKNTNSSGFEVQYAANKKFTKNLKKINVKGSSKTSTTLKSLKKKKTYYVRVRTYKTTTDGKIVSDWSNVKKMKM